MGYQIYYDGKHRRYAGYGVPAYCDQPGCHAEINRGIPYNCGGGAAYDSTGADDKPCCGLSFCSEHQTGIFSRCDICALWADDDFDQVDDMCKDIGEYLPKPYEHPDWIKHILTDESWRGLLSIEQVREWIGPNRELLNHLNRYIGKPNRLPRGKR